MINNDLARMWRFGGVLKIKGLIVNLPDGATIDHILALKNNRRSTLRGFMGGSVNYLKLVTDGAALQISTDPSLWTNLPPGANELMKELQAFK